LVLARTESSFTATELDLAEIAEEQVEQASGAADAMNLRLDLDLRPARLQGDRALIERLVGNLVENAIRHNAQDGFFSVTTYTEGDRAILNVSGGDTVVPEDDLERLFDRFYRPDKSRSRKTGGFGLGLSIVRAVAAAHGGTVSLRAIASGGLDVTVSLPTERAAGPSNAS
jgi:signal transduction histidine kinase